MNLLDLHDFLGSVKEDSGADVLVASNEDDILVLRFYWQRDKLANWCKAITAETLRDLTPQLLDELAFDIVKQARYQIRTLEAEHAINGPVDE